MMRFSRKIWFVLAVAVMLQLAATAASFTASLDRDAITLGENAVLSLTFEGAQPNSLSAPQVAGLQFTQAGTSQSTSWVNGAMTSSITISFQVTPQRAGEFTIPALKVSACGQQLSSQPLKLTVGKVAAPTAEAVNSGNEVAFQVTFAAQRIESRGHGASREAILFREIARRR